MKGKIWIVSLLVIYPLASTLTTLEARNLSYEQIKSYNHTAGAEVVRIVRSVDHLGRNVELDDGSIWQIQGRDSQYTAEKWKMNDPVIIHPTLFPLFSGAQFYIYNEKTRTSALCSLVANPFINVPTHIIINDIDTIRGELQLIDGAGRTLFAKLNPRYAHEYEKWRIGNTIIIGSNEDCPAGWLSDYPIILINIKKHSRSNDYGYIEAKFD